ncbi:hypothetical protein CYMTET_31097 [Cymbomonas tetramitiformis]|uniref:Uncharacterized protein n=1 Tax=Cymbomonas tetramitiformis TaxID=36881 RepID=A0AAE0KTJ1_9CHLO|nr:hypothetical protein CYMTET_31097 [Cymbomonas tetramitiformis]
MFSFLRVALSLLLAPICFVHAIQMEDVATTYAANGKGKGVMCLAGHLKPSLKASSIYLQQCAYALERWKDAFELAGPPYTDIRLAVVTDKFRYNYMVEKDAAFRKFSEEVLDDPIFFEDWVGVPTLRKKPQSSKFQGYPQVWIYKFEAWARSPYETTLFIDYDIHACKGAERIFDKYGDFDIAPMACEHGCWGGTRFDKMFGAHIKTLTDLEKQEDPCTEAFLLSTGSRQLEDDSFAP